MCFNKKKKIYIIQFTHLHIFMNFNTSESSNILFEFKANHLNDALTFNINLARCSGNTNVI